MAVRAGARRRPIAGDSHAAPGELHAAAWLAWLVAGCAAVFLTSNPLYLSLALLAALAVYAAARGRARRSMDALVLFGLAMSLLILPLTVLTGSTGSTVLFTLPAWSAPGWLGGVVFGGDVTAEALVSATCRALTIATAVVLAAVFNGSVDHFRLLRLAPRGLSRLMLSLTVALLVVPEAIEQARAVLEAQRLRGRRARGLRALPGVMLPTLQGALDRAVQRAESLDARGFGSGERQGGAATSIAGVAALGVATCGAFAHFYYGPGIAPALAMAIGASLVGLVLYGSGGVKRAQLRRDAWSMSDVIVIGASGMTIALLFALRLSGAGDADYQPYPEVVAPAFNIAGAAAMVLILSPLVSLLANAAEGES